MDYLPPDLVPLPTMPYNERPVELPLDKEECRTALWRANGNVSTAADLLKVSSARLRKFIKDSPYLSAELQEATERLKDKAQQIVVEALDDVSDPSRQDQMARYVLTNLGADRGFGTKEQKGVSLNMPKGGRFTISWEDGSNLNDNQDMKTIDHEAAE